MQNSFGGKQENCRKPNPSYAPTYQAKQEPREEFSDWPHGLLAIGTFGNNNEIEETLNHNAQTQNLPEDDPSSSEELADFTPEEIGKLQKELTKLLRGKPNKNVEKEIAELPLDRFLNCPSSLEVDRRISNALCTDPDDHLTNSNNKEDMERTLSVILGKCKNVCADNSKKSIGKKSISFLIKKMFVCAKGFAPQPSLRDTLQESRMEKLLRTILHKNIYSQCSPSRASSTRKCLENKNKKMLRKRNEDEPIEGKTDNGCKWVRTDSEYIVLEISICFPWCCLFFSPVQTYNITVPQIRARSQICKKGDWMMKWSSHF